MERRRLQKVKNLLTVAEIVVSHPISQQDAITARLVIQITYQDRTVNFRKSLLNCHGLFIENHHFLRIRNLRWYVILYYRDVPHSWSESNCCYNILSDASSHNNQGIVKSKLGTPSSQGSHYLNGVLTSSFNSKYN